MDAELNEAQSGEVRRPKGEAKFPVSTSALVQRINRKLTAEGQRMRKYRNQDMYYVIDEYRNIMIWDRITDLAGYARKIGAMHQWETLQD